MEKYDSIYLGTNIDSAITNINNSMPKINVLPALNSGNVGQFLKKSNSSGQMAWADVVSVTTKLNGTQKTDMTNLLLFFTNKTVATSAWIKGTNYNNYPYYANITCESVTGNYYPEVIFNPDDAISGYFAPVCESMSGAVKIFASDIPEATITIPTIKCTKAG